MLKAPPPKSSDLHFSVIKCHCRTNDDNIGPKFKKPSVLFEQLPNIVDHQEITQWSYFYKDVKYTLNINFLLLFY